MFQWKGLLGLVEYIFRPGGELKAGEDPVEGLKRLLTEVCSSDLISN